MPDQLLSADSLTILRVPGGPQRQIITDKLLINITNDTAYQYTLRVMDKAAMGPLQPDGFYALTNPDQHLLKAYVVDNPDASPAQYTRLRIRDVTAGTNEWMFAYSNSLGGWYVTLPANAGYLELISTNQATNGWTFIRRYRDPSKNLIAEHVQVYTNFSWGSALLTDTTGAGADVRTRTWTYYDPPPFTPTSSRLPINTVTGPDGGWRKVLQYTNNGLVALELQGIDSSVTNQSSQCRKLTYWYAPVDASNDDGTRNPDSPRKEEEYWKDQLIRRTYYVYSKTNTSPWFDKSIQCPNPGNSIGDAANEVTTTFYDSGTTRVQYHLSPDGTITVPASVFELDGNSTLTVDSGEPDNSTPPLVKRGTRTLIARNARGTVISETAWAILPGQYGPVLGAKISARTNTLDEFDRPIQVDYLDGTFETFSYSCCGLDNTTDRDGLWRHFEYDALHRLLGHTILSYASPLSLTNILDAAGRVTATVRNGGGSWPIVQNRKVYDTAGRVVYETNALGGATIHIESLVDGISRKEVILQPNGGTITNLYAADGSLTNVSGTATFPMRYQYGTETDSGAQRLFTKQIKPDASGNATEWTKDYQDGLGRIYKTVYAAASGSPAKTNQFNNKGQLVKEVDPDGVTTLYRYNAQGELIVTATDLNKDGVVSDYEGATGKDRVTLTTNIWLLASDPDNSRGVDLKRTVTVVWTTDNSSAVAKVSMTETSGDGLHTWQTSYRDQNTPVVTTTDVGIPTEMNNWTRTITQTAPDNSSTVALQQYGRQISVARYDSSGPPNGQITRAAFAYDAHGRQAFVTDARNGTTTFYFNDADQVATTLSPDPGTGPQVTTTFFDNMGRETGVRNPDGNTTTNLYFPNSLLQKTWGSRTYPVEYSYDAQGRMRTNKTWQSFSGGTGTAITRWNYDPYRGWLKSKDYPDAASGVPPTSESTSGPVYTYTPGGRLYTRAWLRPGLSGQPIVTTYKYGCTDASTGNEHGDLVSVEYSNDPASTPNVTYVYDRRGRRSQVARAGMTTTLGYNDANQQSSESYSGGTLAGFSVSSTYNNRLQRDSLGLGGTGTYSVGFAYDSASRLARVTEGVHAVGYSYLANSPLVSQIFFTNNGSLRMTTVRQFDRLNRLQSISSVPTGSGAPSLPLSHAYVYNSANQRIRATLADGSFWVYTYDLLGQVTSGKRYWQDGTPVAGQQFEYGFDDIGNRKSTAVGGDASGGGLRGASYTANRLNQYSSRSVPAFADFLGIANPTASVTVNGNTPYRKGEYFQYALSVPNTSAAQYPLGTIISSFPPGETQTGRVFVPQTPENFGHDADGNLTNDGRWAFTWDAENRLVKMESRANPPAYSNRRLEFAYDHQGRRIYSKVTSLDTGAVLSEDKFLYDGWNLLAELNATNSAIIRSFVWGIDLSGSEQGAGGVGGLLNLTYNAAVITNCFVAYDGNGNVTGLIKADDASVLARYDYGPFGELLRATGPMAKANPFRFSSKYQDDQTDLVYYGFRYLSPSIGSWLSRDPLLQQQGGPSSLYHGGRGQFEGNHLAMRNDLVNRYDLLGLLAFFKNECRGCNAGDPVFSTDGYTHHPKQTCIQNPEGTYVPGSSGSFDHYCHNYDFIHPSLCNTETHVKIKVRNNDECCTMWVITCSYHYNGLVKASKDYSMDLAHFTFMGEIVAPRADLLRSGGSGAASISVHGSRSQQVFLPKGSEMFVFNLQPLNFVHGLPDLISEGGSVSCTGRCIW